MLYPIRCFTCGALIGDKFAEFNKKVKAGEDAGKVLDAMGIKRYCCRRMLLSSIDLSEQIIPYYEAIWRRHIEVSSEG